MLRMVLLGLLGVLVNFSLSHNPLKKTPHKSFKIEVNMSVVVMLSTSASPV